MNGFVGGFVNGSITSVGTLLGQPVWGNLLGGFVGNYITESLNNRDITDPGKPKKDKINIFLTSAGMGLTQAGLGQIGALNAMKKGAGLAEGSAGYWIAKFFEKNLNFTSSLGAYILIDGMVKKYKVGENIRILLCE